MGTLFVGKNEYLPYTLDILKTFVCTRYMYCRYSNNNLFVFISGSSESGINFVEHKLTLEKWLESLDLKEEYVETFKTNLFTEMDRVAAIWDDELTSILDIEKIGHRKRILLSLAGRHGMPHRFGKVKASC